ncbi:hypothetical protein T11_17785 [Trichinella zimbabwensis]|uniref:Uncharacterized protein n=1 Tax=Trichinella zimbabwensis TaxID=268475 RepID=A0A0V1HZD8_9BILA|nr:hypothetical protein T11_17785 [Trichinella zimbabwensis]
MGQENCSTNVVLIFLRFNTIDFANGTKREVVAYKIHIFHGIKSRKEHPVCEFRKSEHGESILQ